MTSKTEQQLQQKKVELWDLSQLDELSSAPKPSAGTAVKPSRVDYQSQATQLLKRGVDVRAHWIPSICVVALLAIVVWASVAEIDQVASGRGQVISASKVQLIQSLDNGLIEEFLVEEGQLVDAGQPLLKLDTTILSANYREQQSRRRILAGRMSRLLAEANGFTAIDFPADLGDETIAIEEALYKHRKNEFYDREKNLIERLALAKEELSILKSAQQSVTRLEKLHIQRQTVELQGQLDTLRSGHFSNAMEQYDSLRAEVVALDEAMLRDGDRLERATFRAPLQGVVNKIHINTIGRVINSGATIMEIVPHDDSLLIEANIRPADVGFLHKDQQAIVRFTAYDFTVYGGMDATIEYIGVDTVSDENGERYYPVQLRSQSAELGQDKNGNTLSIIPGMVADVSIVTEKKTILEYLLMPVMRASERAMRER